jgi:anti-repressor protein
MNELIKIEEREDGKQAVSARELHHFLGSKKDFSDWIKHRIAKYGFIENQDFEVFPFLGENPLGGRPLTEYALTIDMAKEISMVEGNDKGKQARQYFIAMEKKAKSLEKSIPKTYAEALMEAALLAQQNEKLIAETTQAKQIAADCQRETLIISDTVADFTGNKYKHGKLTIRYNYIRNAIHSHVKPKHLKNTYNAIYKKMTENLDYKERLDFSEAVNKAEWIRSDSGRLEVFRAAALDVVSNL